MEGGSFEPPWHELLGGKQWEGLLEPLDLRLRQLILRCGDICQVTYDAFNNDEHSKYTGSSRYGKRNLLQKVAFPSATAYQVVCYLYATASVSVPQAFLLHSLSREAWSRESNWIGYIAVTSDEVSRANGRREIYVAWRGTIRNLEWVDVLTTDKQSIDLLLANKGKEQQQQQRLQSHWYDRLIHRGGGDSSSSSDNDDDEPMVMKGWYTIYTSDDPKSSFTKFSARDQFLAKMKELIDSYKDEELGLSVTLAGHSLGACLAVLAGFDMVENGLSEVGNRGEFIPVCAIVFGCPQIGNKAFNERLERLPNFNVLRVGNVIDLIPHFPSQLLDFVSTGLEFVVDTRKSPYLKDSKNPSDWHNLQAMLHIVAGWNGKEEEFELKVKRSIALVNKSCDFLKDECLIPGSWWVEKNKGLVLGEDGEWQLAPPSEEDIPVPEFQ